MTMLRNAPHPPSFVAQCPDQLPVYRKEPDGELLQVDSLHVRVLDTPRGKVLRTPQIDLFERVIEQMDPEMLLPASKFHNDLFLRADDIKTWVDRNWI
jgi:hypothetical protein